MHHIDFKRIQQPEGETITRFAPSPTGDLHLGHVLSAIWVWGIASVTNAKVIVRLEDHDQGRCREKYSKSIIDDLEWLGLLAHPRTSNSDTIIKQSDHFNDWEQIASSIEEHCYNCHCSRREIKASQKSEEISELRYYNTCRYLGLTKNQQSGLRACLPDKLVEFDDLLLGKQVQHPTSQCGDILLKERNGHWTYHFGVCADDMRQNVNLIIRGQDILSSTARQILLSKLIGNNIPIHYIHHPLIMDRDTGKKLSKRDRSLAIHELRKTGYSAQDVLLLAAKQGGLVHDDRPVKAISLGELFYGRARIH